MTLERFAAVKAASDRIAYLKLLGIELLEAAGGQVKMKMPFRPELLQPSVVHGGAIYSLADAAAAHALLSLVVDEEGLATVEQRINFLKPVREGALYCEARIVHLGRTLAYAEASVTLGDGTLVARSAATLMRLPLAAVRGAAVDRI